MNTKEVNKILLGFGCDSFNRFEIFLNIADKLHGKIYWVTLKDVYQMSDNLYHWRHEVRKCFQKRTPGRTHLFSNADKEYFNNLPQRVKIYRAMSKVEYQSRNFGISWTLDENVARFFANQYSRDFSTLSGPKIVHSILVNKKSIVGYWNDRNEREAIYLSED